MGGAIPVAARRDLERLFDPVREQMAAMAYPDLATFLNELVLRACTIKGVSELGVMDFAPEALLNQEALQGFYPIAAVWEILADYDRQRRTWPDFRSFAPRLLERLAARTDELLAAREHFASREIGDGLSISLPAGGPAPGPDLYLGVGASSGPGQATSQFLLETTAQGPVALTLMGDRGTDHWFYAALGLKPRQGVLVLDAQVKGQDIRQEATQFDNAWIGLVLTDRSGGRTQALVPFQGSFDWTPVHQELNIDPARVRQLEFMFFLSKSGSLSARDIRLHWK